MARKNKTNKANKKQAQQQKKQPPRLPKPSVGLSDCTRCYAKALIDPFAAEPCCIPSAIPMPSVKHKVFVKGAFLIGTTSGFVAFAPENSMCSDPAALGQAGCPVWFTDNGGANYGGNQIVVPTTAGCDSANSNAPYTRADFSNEYVQSRIVAAGLRVRFTGASLTDNGTVVGLSEPDHLTLQSYSVANLRSYDGVDSISLAAARGWQTIIWRPADVLDFEFADHMVDSVAEPLLAFIATGTTGQSLEYEAVTIFEATGPKARGKTHSSSDPSGFAAASNAAAKLSVGVIAPKAQTSFLNRVEGGLRELTGFVSSAAQVANAARGLYAAGALLV